jgi:lipopolysaccharide export system permease protein
MIADTGRMEQTSAGPRFYLQDGMRQLWRGGRVSWLAFDNYAIDIAFYGQDGGRKRNPDERSIGELFARDGLTEKQAAAYRAEAHQRLTWPLLALSLPLFALATLFSSEFNRRGQTKRLLVATIGMVAILLLYFVCRSASIKHGWLTAGLYVLAIGVAVASSYLLLSARVIALRWRMPGAMRLPSVRAR